LRIIFILVILTLSTAFAGQITGTISDSLTNRPLSHVSIVIKDKNILTHSDSSGAFRLTNLAEGYYTVFFKRIGYREKSHNIFLKNPYGIKKLEISLTESPISTSEIVIEGKKWINSFYDPLQISKKISAAHIIETIGGFEDPLRAIQNISGAQARHDYSSQFYIHGCSPEQHVVVLDGLPLSNAYRVKFMNYGGLSIFSPDILKSLNIIKGGYDASIGNRLGAQIELQSSEATAEWQNRLSINLLSSRYSLQGPISDNISTTFSIRRSYYDWLMGIFSDETVVYPLFFDFYNKWSWQLSDDHRLSFIQILGKEDAKFLETQNKNFKTNMKSRSFNSTSHLAFNGIISDLFQYRLIAAWQANTDSMQFLGHNHNNYHYNTDRKTLKADFNYNNSFSGGVSVEDVYQSANISMNYFNKNYVVPDLLTNYRLYSLFAQTNLEFDKKLFINLSHRIEYSNLLKSFYESPRFSFVYGINEYINIKGRAGLYYQFPELSNNYFSETPLNLIYNINNMPPMKSHYLAISLDYNYNNIFLSEIEFFSRVTENIPQMPFTDKEITILNNDESLNGDAQALGIDFSFKYNPGKMNFKLDYSYTHSKMRKDKYLEYRPLYFDQRHWFNGNINYRISANWLFGTSVKAGSGFPHHYIIGFVQDYHNNPDILYSENFKYVPYFRWDARINYESDFISVYFELLNITGAKNFDSYYCDSNNSTDTYSYTIYNIHMMPRMPVFGLSLQF